MKLRIDRLIENTKPTHIFRAKDVFTLTAKLLFLSGMVAILDVSAEEKSENYALEEVFVQAQKRLETEQEVPAALNVYSDDMLDTTSWDDVTDLADLIPSLEVVGTTKTRKSVFIRSIGTNKYDVGTEGSVGVFVDGVYIPRVSSIMQNLIELDRLEILRGPQGTLYGRNTIGGAISLYSKSPSYDWGGKLKLIVSDPEAQELTANVSGPVTDKLRVYAGIYTKEEDGFRYDYVSDSTEHEDIEAARLGFEFDASDTINIRFFADHISQDLDTLTGEIISPTGDIWSLNPPELAPLITVEARNEYLSRERADQYANWSTVPGFSYLDSDSASLHVKFTGDNINVDSISGFRDQDLTENFDDDRTQYDIWESNIAEQSKTISQEIRVYSEESGAFTFDDKLEWLVGTYLYHDDVQRSDSPAMGRDSFLYGAFDAMSMLIYDPETQPRPEFPPSPSPTPVAIPVQALFNDFSQETYGQLLASLPLFPGFLGIPGTASLADFIAPPYPFEFLIDQQTKAWAVFGQSTYALTEQVNLTFGARYSEDEKEFRYTYRSDLPLFGGPEDDFSFPDSVTFSSFDPKLVLEWFPEDVDNLNSYISFSKGYKSGGVQFGVMSEELARRTFDKETIYATEVGVKSRWLNEKLQFNTALFNYDYRDLQVYQIAVVQTATGPVESSITDNAASSTVNGLESEIKYMLRSDLLVQATISLMDSTFDKFESSGQNFSGNKMPAAPESAVWLSVQYDKPTALGDLGVRVDYSWRDAQFFEPANRYKEDGYGLTNLSLWYATPKENINVRLFCTNCMDVEYRTSVTPLTDNSGWAATGDLRRVGLALTYNY